MQDLLKEEEFIKTNYDPWKLFSRFYIIAVLQIVVVQVAASFWAAEFTNAILFSAVVFLIYILLPILTLVILFTRNTRIFSIDRKTKVIGVAGLILCYTLTNLIVNIGKAIFTGNLSKYNAMLQLLASGAYFVVVTLLSLGVIYIVSRLVKKRQKVTITK